jgi:hypothetical protein
VVAVLVLGQEQLVKTFITAEDLMVLFVQKISYPQNGLTL